MQVMAFKVTLKTPEGDKEIECAGERHSLCKIVVLRAGIRW